METGITATCIVSKSNGKFILDSTSYSGDFLSFIDQLPNRSTFYRDDQKMHRCAATPAAAWRIKNIDLPIEICATEEVDQMAMRFAESCYEAAESLSRDCNLQPEICKLDSWGHQIEGYHFARSLDACLLAMWMGTGKSKIAVDLVVNRNAQRTVILCPVSVLGVWRREFAMFAPANFEPLILDKKSMTGVRKKKEIEKYLDYCTANGLPAIIVINYESAKSKTMAPFFLTRDWDIAICDESHRIKSYNSAVSKFAAELGRHSEYRLCLTGTPMPHSPLDLFGQFRFLDRGLFGTSWTNFRSRYAITNPMFPSQVQKYINCEELADRMKLITYQVDQSVLDLPEVIHTDISGELTKETRRIYDELESEMISEVSVDNYIVVPNALVKLLRLQQLTGGFYKKESDDKTYILGNEKVKLLEEIISGIPKEEPVIVFCRFRQDLLNIRNLAEKMGRTYGEISGMQKDLTPESKMPKGIQIMGVQISSGGVGIDLTRSHYGIYYSIGHSLGDYEQSMARQHRPGQTETTFFYHLTMKDTIDEAIYRALERRANLVQTVIDHLKRGNG